jgi:hypothetical protein
MEPFALASGSLWRKLGRRAGIAPPGAAGRAPDRRNTMKIRMLSWGALGILAWAVLPAWAQDEGTKSKEAVKEETKAAIEIPVATCLPPCGPFKVLWAEHDVPIQRLEPREVITEIKRPTYVIEYKEVKKQVTDIVIKTREVTREVPCTTMQPCTVTDPHTGHCSTVWQPVTEIKVVKEMECSSVPETREVTVQVPYLKQVEEIVPQKTIILEYKTVMQKRGCPVVVPGGAVLRDRWLVAEPPCHHDGH